MKTGKRIKILFLLMGSLTLHSWCGADPLNKEDLTSESLNPERIKEVFLIPLSHLDIGFTDSLDIVAMKCKDDIDQAIQLCEKYEDFYWTIESLWQLEQWLLRSTPAEINGLKKLIHSQRIEVTAMYSTLRSGLLGLEDANRLLYPKQRVQEQLGIKFDTAIQNDVPGYADVYPRIFADGGIKYFLTGINTGHGGGAYIPRNQQPFLWKSRNGQSVLTWIDHDSYTSIWLWGVYNVWYKGSEVLPENGKIFREAIRTLEKTGYPYDVFLLIAALGDNKPPVNYIPLIERVRKWNQSGQKPSLKFATPRQFFSEIERQQGKRDFSAWRGNWHGLWDARLWNPAGNSLGRRAQQLLPVAEMLASINSLNNIGTYYKYDLTQAFLALLLHCEHTCGGDPSWIGIFNPALFKKTAIHQNELTIRFAKDACRTAENILDVHLTELAKYLKARGSGILVFNSLQWPRDFSIVSCSIPLTLKEKELALIDMATNKKVPFVLTESGSQIVFPVANLPSMSYKWYSLVPKTEEKSQLSKIIFVTSDTIVQNQFYRLECDPQFGHIKSIIDLETKRELVDKSSSMPMNSLVIKDHKEFYKSGGGKLVQIPCELVKEKGPFFERIIIRRKDSFWKMTTITLFSALKRIDILHTLERNGFPDVPLETHSQYYSFAFPFNLAEANLKIFVDGADGFFAYPEDYLPGVTLGAVQSQYGIHLQNGNQYGITIANKQAFNWTVGEINFNRQATQLDAPPLTMINFPRFSETKSVYPITKTLFSNVVQFATEGWTADYGRTYIRETEPGTESLLTFEYFITTSSGNFSPAKTMRFFRESVIAPVASFSSEWVTGIIPTINPVSNDFLKIEPDNVLVTAFKKAEFGSSQDYILRLKETSGRESQVKIMFKVPVQNATLCSLTEIPMDSSLSLPVKPIELKLSPFEVATVRLRFQKDINF